MSFSSFVHFVKKRDLMLERHMDLWGDDGFQVLWLLASSRGETSLLSTHLEKELWIEKLGNSNSVVTKAKKGGGLLISCVEAVFTAMKGTMDIEWSTSLYRN
jgi:hypothetical protein